MGIVRLKIDRRVIHADADAVLFLQALLPIIPALTNTLVRFDQVRHRVWATKFMGRLDGQFLGRQYIADWQKNQ